LYVDPKFVIPDRDRDDSVDVDLAFVQREGRGGRWGCDPLELWLPSRSDGSLVSAFVCQKSFERDEPEPAEVNVEPGPSSDELAPSLDAVAERG